MAKKPKAIKLETIYPECPFCVILVEEPQCKHELVINQEYKVIDTYKFNNNTYFVIEVNIRKQTRNILYQEKLFEIKNNKEGK